MHLARAALKNPAAVAVAVTLLAVFGVLRFWDLPIQLVPDIERPTLTLSTVWKNAAPQELEAAIIEPQERLLKTMSGLHELSTQVERGRGVVNMTFTLETDLRQATVEAINKLNQAPALPPDAEEPVLEVSGGAVGVASLMVRATSGEDIATIPEFQQVIEDIVKERLLRVGGVSRVDLESLRQPELRIVLDPYAAAARGLVVQDIAGAVSSAINLTGGAVDIGRRQYTVRFVGQTAPEDMEDIVVGHGAQGPIYLRDLAKVERTLADPTGFTMKNGQPSFYIVVYKRAGANTVELLDVLNMAIQELNDGPLEQHGLVIELSYDASVHIRNAVKLVVENLGLGVVLSLGLLYFFLRDRRAVLAISCVIPLAIVVSLVVLGLLGRSLNVISLAALALSVGLVLDAAIIVQENIMRLKSGGMSALRAALEGTSRVAPALFSATVTSIAIFLPLLAMKGVEGQLFADLAITLSTAVATSFIAAVTIFPVLNNYWGEFSRAGDPFARYWGRLSAGVMRLTATPMRRLSWTVGLIGGAACMSFFLTPQTDFLPRAPTDAFFVSFDVPPGGNINFLRSEVGEVVIDRLTPYMSGEKQPRVRSYNLYIDGPSDSGLFVYPADPSETEALMEAVRADVLANLPDTVSYLFRASMINVDGGEQSRRITVDIQGADLGALIAVARVGQRAMQKAIPGADVRPSPGLDLAEPELRLVPRRERISRAGLNARTVGEVVRAYTGGLFVTEYFDGNRRYHVLLRGPAWETPEELAALPVQTPLAGTQNIGDLMEIGRTVGPTQLRRVDGKRTVSLSLLLPESMGLGAALQLMNAEVLPAMRAVMQPDVRLRLGSNTNEMLEAIQQMAGSFFMALFILFVILCGMFRSAGGALMVFSVIPLAVAGGLGALAMLNLVAFQSLDLLTMVGFVILLGLVVNNAILLVDQAREGERQGLPRARSVARAIRIRARPIYMSTLTSLVGMIPLMLMPGTGAEIYRGLATVIVGGMAASAAFTLILLPTLLRFGEGKDIPIVERAQAVAAE